MIGMFNKNSIHKIVKTLPPELIVAFGKQNFYSVAEVKFTFNSELKTEHNIEYAFAMFCTQADFDGLGFESTYNELRTDISKKCFGRWPRFNFDSLLDYSRRSTIGIEAGALGGDGGCGGGGGE